LSFNILPSTDVAAIVVVSSTAAEPLKLTPLAVTSPVKEKALLVANVVAVSALPVTSPVTSPYNLPACIFALELKDTVLEEPVDDVIANLTLSLPSSQPINTLSEPPLSCS